MTLALSPNVFKAPSIGTPIIHNLYCRAAFISNGIFIAINSEPKVDDMMVFCGFKYQRIGAPLIKIRIPVVDHHVARHVV
jgi:hypothetical protein